MHTLDWLNSRGHILCGAIQPIGVHFYRSCFHSHYQGLCDRACFFVLFDQSLTISAFQTEFVIVTLRCDFIHPPCQPCIRLVNGDIPNEAQRLIVTH